MKSIFQLNIWIEVCSIDKMEAFIRRTNWWVFKLSNFIAISVVRSIYKFIHVYQENQQGSIPYRELLLPISPKFRKDMI